MMRRTAVVLALLACALVAEAQPPQRTYTIGFLGMTSASEHARQIEALRLGLREAGYREGANLVIEYRFARSRLECLPDLAKELVRLHVDLIVTHTASRIGYLQAPVAQTPEVAESMGREMDAAARALGLEVKRSTVKGSNELPRAFSQLTAQKVHAVIVQNTSVLTAHAATIADFAVKYRLPTIGAPLFVEAGGLLAYGANVEDLYLRAAGYVDRILKGARPGDLPVEQPTRFDLIVNLKTARRLGLTLPPALLSRADRVIE